MKNIMRNRDLVVFLTLILCLTFLTMEKFADDLIVINNIETYTIFLELVY